MRFVIPWMEHWVQYGHDIFAEAVRRILIDMGHKVDTPHRLAVNPGRYGPEDVALFMDNTCGMAWERLGGLKCPARRVYFNMDALRRRHVGWVKRFKYDLVVDYNLKTTRQWRREGVNCVYCPQGYHESYEELKWRNPDDLFEPAIYFMTGPNPRREKIMKKELKGLDIKVMDFRFSRQKTMKLVASPGVHLNINRNRLLTFGWMRIVMMHLTSRSFVLSEELDWVPDGLTRAKHWDACSLGEMADRARYWMARPKERAEIGQAGYEFFRDNHRLDEGLALALRKGGIL